MDLDLEAIRKEVEATLDPEWVKKYGDQAWKAALTVIGEPLPPETLPETPGKMPPGVSVAGD